MLAGCMVDNMVVGGPAEVSGMLQKGDIIVTVDGETVTPDTVCGDWISCAFPVPKSHVAVNAGDKRYSWV